MTALGHLRVAWEHVKVWWSVAFALLTVVMQCIVAVPSEPSFWSGLDFSSRHAVQVLSSIYFWACWIPLLISLHLLTVFARKHDLSASERGMMVWFLTNAFWFHTGCDILSGYVQIMPRMTELYKYMSPAHHAAPWDPSRVFLDCGYMLELMFEVPLCLWVLFLYVQRHPARYSAEIFAVAVQFAGTVCYYLPAYMRHEEYANWLSCCDRCFGSVWIIFPFCVLYRHFQREHEGAPGFNETAAADNRMPLAAAEEVQANIGLTDTGEDGNRGTKRSREPQESEEANQRISELLKREEGYKKEKSGLQDELNKKRQKIDEMNEKSRGEIQGYEKRIRGLQDELAKKRQRENEINEKSRDEIQGYEKRIRGLQDELTKKRQREDAINEKSRDAIQGYEKQISELQGELEKERRKVYELKEKSQRVELANASAGGSQGAEESHAPKVKDANRASTSSTKGMPELPWKCDKCDETNKAARSHCNNCGQERPEGCCPPLDPEQPTQRPGEQRPASEVSEAGTQSGEKGKGKSKPKRGVAAMAGR